MAKVGPLAWRYDTQEENIEFQSLLQGTENVKPGYVDGYPGSSIPLANCAAEWRACALYGRPDLLAKVAEFGRGGRLPVTATACAAASMKASPALIKERMEINKRNRDRAFEHIEKFLQPRTSS